MKTRSNDSRSMMETLEGRSMMSAVAEADFNGDGRLDKAVVTNPTTITVSLRNADNTTYAVSAILTAPKNQPIQDVAASLFNNDDKMDIVASGSKNSGSYGVVWVNNGDGTFTYVEPFRWKHTRWWI
jgi:hypothetical protein